jgi:digeranylgeranylglycerophospholipid reductase
MKNRFDLVVAGAGPAGCMLAKKVRDAGFSVALLERKPKKAIGYDWEVACEKKIFGRVTLRFPDESLFAESPDMYRFSSTRHASYVEMNAKYDSVFYIRQADINNYLLDAALTAGVTLIDRCTVGEYLPGLGGADHTLMVERTGVMGQRKATVSAPVAADCTGTDRTIAKQLSEDSLILHRVGSTDLVTAWNEICEVDDEQIGRLTERFGLVPGVYHTRIGVYHAYQVLFLRKNGTISLVFGSAMGSELPTAREICADFKRENPFFGRTVFADGKLIPIRRSLDNMVADGFVCIGDSACQVVPTTGSGVSSCMYAADIAGQAIVDGLNTGDVSRATLWKYNSEYQTKRGGILASYDIVRRFIQHLPPRLLDQIFERGLFQDENFIQIYASDRIMYNIGQLMDGIGKILTNPTLLPLGFSMVQALRDSEHVLNQYKTYPKTWNKTEFFTWLYQTHKIFKKPAYFSEFSIDSFPRKSINFLTL